MPHSALLPPHAPAAYTPSPSHSLVPFTHRCVCMSVFLLSSSSPVRQFSVSCGFVCSPLPIPSQLYTTTAHLSIASDQESSTYVYYPSMRFPFCFPHARILTLRSQTIPHPFPTGYRRATSVVCIVYANWIATRSNTASAGISLLCTRPCFLLCLALPEALHS